MGVGSHQDAPGTRGRALRAIVWTAVAALVVLSVSSAGYLWLSRSGDGCTGDLVTTTVAASPDQFPVMSELANRWNDDAPEVGERCVRVSVLSAEPSKVAAALGPAWDENRDGARPDVWAPDSIAWTFVAAARPEAQPLLPEQAPSLASSAIVLALPRPMAEAMGWPKRQVLMPELMGALATGKTWADFGHAEWGPIKFGITDPTQSAAGINLLLSIIDRNADRKISDRELTASVAFSSSVTAAAPSAETFFDQAAQAPAAPSALASAVAFPTDEHSLAAYRADTPAQDFVPLYLGDQTMFADYPYAVLQAPWVDSTRRDTAARFRDYLLGVEGQRAYGGRLPGRGRAVEVRAAARQGARVQPRPAGHAPGAGRGVGEPDHEPVEPVPAAGQRPHRPRHVRVHERAGPPPQRDPATAAAAGRDQGDRHAEQREQHGPLAVLLEADANDGLPRARPARPGAGAGGAGVPP